MSFYNFIGVYFLWILLYYVGSNLHSYYCTPLTWWGFLITPFIVETPHCKLMRWIIAKGPDNINLFWTFMATIAARYMVLDKNKKE